MTKYHLITENEVNSDMIWYSPQSGFLMNALLIAIKIKMEE
jgi:hypothetical protein